MVDNFRTDVDVLHLLFSSPTPHITWKKRDKPLASRARLLSGGAVLEIPDVQLEDEGLYTCTVNNSIGSAMTKGLVFVNGKKKSVFPSHN